MIIRRLLRPSSVQPSWTCAGCRRLPSLVQQSRDLHRVPPLNYDSIFQEHGVPGLFSAEGYNLAWTQYQDIIIQKLNELTAGEAYESMQVKALALQFARDPMNASLFNHASMAHNNQFFFSTLASSPAKLEKCPQLEESLIATFGSIETLKATFLDSAAGMFGPGFTWLVWARSVDGATAANGPQFGARKGHWRILNTYLAGTPYAQAGFRQQGIDMNNQTPGSYKDYRDTQPANVAGAFGAFSQSGREQAGRPPGGTTIMPVMCVNTWEHVWIYDFGLAGKRRFLSDWWDAVDWGVVEQNAPSEAKQIAHFKTASI